MGGTTEVIPDKLFFKIGEVARITGIKPHVLRYWESEFGTLKPVKNRGGQRVYRRRDVEMVLEIKSLLYDRKFTIEGARKMLSQRGRSADPQLDLELKEERHIQLLQDIRDELRTLLRMLEDDRA